MTHTLLRNKKNVADVCNLYQIDVHLIFLYVLVTQIYHFLAKTTDASLNNSWLFFAIIILY